MFPSPPPPPPPPPPLPSSVQPQQTPPPLPTTETLSTTPPPSTNLGQIQSGISSSTSFHFNEFLFRQQLQQQQEEEQENEPFSTERHLAVEDTAAGEQRSTEPSLLLTTASSSSSSSSSASISTESSIHSIELEVTLPCYSATITKGTKNQTIAKQLREEQFNSLRSSLQSQPQPSIESLPSLQQLSPSKVLQGELRRYRSNMNYPNNHQTTVNDSESSFHHSNHTLNGSQTNLKVPLSDSPPIIRVIKTPTSVSKFNQLSQHIQNNGQHHLHPHHLHPHQPTSSPPHQNYSNHLHHHHSSQHQLSPPPPLPSPHHHHSHSHPQQHPTKASSSSQHYKCGRISHHNNNNNKKKRRSLIKSSLGQYGDPEQQSNHSGHSGSTSNGSKSRNGSRNDSKCEKQQRFDGSKKSRCILFSQIYLITHISITICLNEKFIPNLTGAAASLATPSGTLLSIKEIILNLYLIYIMIVSLLFFLLLRCYATPSDSNNSNVNELTEQSPILYGAVCLGVSELLLTVFSLTRCFESEFILIPVLKFCFTLFLMHFLLTQIIHSDHIGLRNIAIAHLVSTQLSLWILSLGQISSTVSRNYLLGEPYRHQTGLESICNYTFDLERFRLIYPKLGTISLFNQTSIEPLSLESPVLFSNQTGEPTVSGDTVRTITVPFLFLQLESFLWPTLNVLSHQFKLLTIFILVTMWFTNNQSKINFIRAKLSDEEVFRSALAVSTSNLQLDSVDQTKLKRQQLLIIGSGLLFVILAIVTTIFSNIDTLRYCTLILIQVSITIISLVGLFIRGRKKYLNPKYQINVLKHHFIIFSTLLVAYIDCFLNVVLQLQDLFQTTSSNKQWSPIAEPDQLSISLTVTPTVVSLERVDQLLALFSCLCLLVQITIQTYLLRLQGKKLVDMQAIFALLVCANFALLCLDVNSGFVDLYGDDSGGRRNNYRYYRHPSIAATGTATPSIDPVPNQWQLAGESIRNILSIFITLNRTYCTLIFVYFWRMRT